MAKESTGNGVRGKGCGSGAAFSESCKAKVYMEKSPKLCAEPSFKHALAYSMMIVLLIVARISIVPTE